MLDWIKKIEKIKVESRRFDKTYNFLQAALPPPAKILDLGTPNRLSEHLRQLGYVIENTQGEDLDLEPNSVAREGFDAVTAFEILEHMVNPMGALQEIKAPRLFASIPLSLWFSKAYQSKTDQWDRHFHEFEDWQFDWLLEKSGWRVVRKEKWTNPSIVPGIRPLLRAITDRYYAIEAERI